jgi:hypothetical protein
MRLSKNFMKYKTHILKVPSKKWNCSHTCQNKTSTDKLKRKEMSWNLQMVQIII